MTHAHPDHIGSAAWFQEHTDCRIYASAGEKRWIENIDLQFQERPISLEVIRTAGHSIEGLSFRLGKDMFIGDAIPVLGDIPIMKANWK